MVAHLPSWQNRMKIEPPGWQQTGKGIAPDFSSYYDDDGVEYTNTNTASLSPSTTCPNDNLFVFTQMDQPRPTPADAPRHSRREDLYTR